MHGAVLGEGTVSAITTLPTIIRKVGHTGFSINVAREFS